MDVRERKRESRPQCPSHAAAGGASTGRKCRQAREGEQGHLWPCSVVAAARGQKGSSSTLPGMLYFWVVTVDQTQDVTLWSATVFWGFCLSYLNVFSSLLILIFQIFWNMHFQQCLLHLAYFWLVHSACEMSLSRDKAWLSPFLLKTLNRVWSPEV